MDVQILVSLIAAIASLIVGIAGNVFNETLASTSLGRLLGGREKRQEESYSERMSRLTQNLTTASQEVDSVLAELAQVMADREKAVVPAVPAASPSFPPSIHPMWDRFPSS